MGISYFKTSKPSILNGRSRLRPWPRGSSSPPRPFWAALRVIWRCELPWGSNTKQKCVKIWIGTNTNPANYMDVTPTTWSNPSYFSEPYVYVYIYILYTNTEAISEMHGWFDLRRALLFWGEKWNQGRHGDSATQPCVPGMPPNPWTFPSHRLKRNNLTKAMNQYQWFFDESVPRPDINPGWCLFTNHTWFNLVQLGSSLPVRWFLVHSTYCWVIYWDPSSSSEDHTSAKTQLEPDYND